ncbi:hypothetical protein [Sporosarcina sp. ITBMC105]
MKRFIIYNVLICLIVCISGYSYIKNHARSTIASTYALQYTADKYGLDEGELELLDVTYRRGMGVYEITLQSNVTKEEFASEVRMANAHLVSHFYDQTKEHRKQQSEER